jgi:hypothetical protein
MSSLPPRPDICRMNRDGGFVPKAGLSVNLLINCDAWIFAILHWSLHSLRNKPVQSKPRLGLKEMPARFAWEDWRSMLRLTSGLAAWHTRWQRLALPGRAPQRQRGQHQRIDNTLLKALARAHRWRRMIESDEYPSITELAQAEGVNESYACRVLRLNLLAPIIVTVILDGRHNCDVMLKDLMKPLPVRWGEQIAALKNSDRA